MFLKALLLSVLTSSVSALDNFHVDLLAVTNPDTNPKITSLATDDFTNVNLRFTYYDYTASGKSIVTTLQKVDNTGACVAATTSTKLFLQPVPAPVVGSGQHTLSVDVKYIHETIASEPQFYSEVGTNAYIKFCVLEEYKYGSEVYGSVTVKVTVQTNLEASCKYCPIDLQNTTPISKDLIKDFSDTLSCGLCSPGPVGPFKVGDQVDICVQYPNGEAADICVRDITGADVYQSTQGPLAPTQQCREQHGCDGQPMSGCPCFTFDDTHLVFNGVTASKTALSCGYKISFIVGQRWFTGIYAGNPLAIEIHALLKYGHNFRRLGQGDRELDDSIPVTFSSDNMGLVDCEKINHKAASLKHDHAATLKKIKNAAGNSALLAKLRKHLAAVEKQSNALKPSQRQCSA